ncbi:MAG TPA: glutamate-5-semialdehyde dehydrogenase [Candidatus Limiplasma sp.]|nr:glutamate-5-semialdehyde dehydrogenase [Candidatus Limiplasma sp.]
MSVESIRTMSQSARRAGLILSSSTLEQRNAALLAIADAIQAHLPEIFAANEQDMQAAAEEKLAAPLLSRLRFSQSKAQRVIDGLTALTALPDPLGRVQYANELAEGLKLYRTTCPIGVIGVIFESRPDALVQISSLCLKSGNALLLKGGREALHTNQALHAAILEGTAKAGIPDGWCHLLQTREDVSEMLKQDDCLDLIIPRGSKEFVRYIMNNSNIPVLGHADGVCHVYVDKNADLDVALKVVMDAKAYRLSVCNTAETLLVHRDHAKDFLPIAAVALKTKNIEIRGDETTCNLIECKRAAEADWSTEYLDAILSIKVVDSLDEAIEHINHYGSGHTDSIISRDPETIERFMTLVDSADVFANCSTQLADGFMFGLGAEVGIATGKLHARGPMGLEGLCTYKYKLYGKGHTLADINDGKTPLIHRKIDF